MNMSEAIPYFREADSFDLRRTWKSVLVSYRVHQRLVWLTTLMTVGLMLLYIVVWPPVYRAEVVLAASSPKDDQRDEFYSMWAVFRRDDLADEVQLFTSKPVLAEVARRMKLTYDDVYHPPLSHAGYLWQESWPGKAWRWVKETAMPPVRTGEAPTPEQIDFARTVESFKSGVSLDPVPETNIGLLTVSGPDPRVGKIANEIVTVYFEQRRARQSAEAQEAYRSLEAVTEQARQDLLALEQRMERYYTNSDMMLMFEKDKVEVSQLLTTRAVIEDLRSNIAANQRELATVNAQLSREPADILSTRTVQRNPVAEDVNAKLGQVELARKLALLHYRADSPEVREFDRQAEVLRAQLAALPATSDAQSAFARNPSYEALRSRKAQLEAAINGQRAAIVARGGQINDLQRSVEQIPEKMKISHDLGRERESLEKKYTVLRDKLMIAAVSAATVNSAPNPIRVVDPATAPDKPSWPMPKLLLLAAAIFGFGAGLALALLLDAIQGWITRSRLAGSPSAPPIYGIVGQDREFTAKLFPR